MNLTTKTARRLKECENILIDNHYTENSRLRLESRIAKKEIINFKNELKEIMRKDNKGISGMAERLLKIDNLIQEIESVENG